MNCGEEYSLLLAGSLLNRTWRLSQPMQCGKRLYRAANIRLSQTARGFAQNSGSVHLATFGWNVAVGGIQVSVHRSSRCGIGLGESDSA